MLRRLWFRLVRFGFRLLYNEMAFTYDRVSRIVSLGDWRSWQRAGLAYLPDPAAGPVLELAHGTGDLQLDLHAAGYRALGCDLSPFMGRIASRKLRRAAAPANLVRSRAQGLPFPDGSFAAVIATFPTDFIVAPDTLHEVHRVLRAGAPLIIVTSGLFTGRGVLKHILEWAYRITGQRSGQALDASVYFMGYGFEVVSLEVDCGTSQAQLVVAHKR